MMKDWSLTRLIWFRWVEPLLELFCCTRGRKAIYIVGRGRLQVMYLISPMKERLCEPVVFQC